MDMKKRTAYLAEAAPKLREKDVRAVNALYPAYIFRRRKTREVWTSCCGRHAVLKEGHPLLDAPHTREWTQRELYWEARHCWVGHYGMNPPEPPPEPVDCPFCGKKAAVKELGRTGKRDNLSAFRRVIVLRKRGGVLWGLGFRTEKDYEWKGALTAPPRMTLIHIYRFEAGRAEHIKRGYWAPCEWHGYERVGGSVSSSPPQGEKMKNQILKAGWKFSDGFCPCSEYGTGYDLIDMDGETGTPFQYCCFDQYRGSDQMRYLALCAVYPRQVEMLLKAGLHEIVTDMAEKGKRNARVVNWGDPNPKAAFGLNGAELRAFLASGCGHDLVAMYKRLRKLGEPVGMEAAADIYRNMGNRWQDVFKLARNEDLKPLRLYRYLAEQGMVFSAALQAWKDYVDHARQLGDAVHRSDVLLPADLGAAHDRAAERYRRQRKKLQKKEEQERLRALNEGYAARKEALKERYAVAVEGLVVRVPEGAEEIAAEGEALKHCVGGYAERHIRGMTTILFLRKASVPDKPFLTIEMDGARLRQIHGYRNEGMYSARRIAPDPRETYAWFLDPWLKWIERGSPRKKDGTPRLKITKERKSA